MNYFQDDAKTFKKCCKSGFVPNYDILLLMKCHKCIKFLLKHNYISPDTVLLDAINNNDIKLLRYSHKYGANFDNPIVYSEIINNANITDLPCIYYVLSHMDNISTKFKLKTMRYIQKYKF